MRLISVFMLIVFLFGSIAAGNDSEATVRLRYGAALRAAGQPQEALPWVDHAVRLDPANPDGWLERARIWADLKRTDLAIENLTRVIQLRPRAAAPYYMRAKLWWSEGESLRAEHDLSCAIERNKKLCAAFVLRAYCRIERRDLSAAMLDAERAVELEPDRARTYTVRARVYEELGQLLLAEADYDQAVNIEQDNPEAYLKRGEARLRLKNLAGALEDANHVRKLDPRSPEAYRLSARVWSEMMRWEQAEADLSTAIQFADSDLAAECHLERGIARTMLGREAEARSDFARCLELKPSWQSKVMAACEQAIERREGK